MISTYSWEAGRGGVIEVNEDETLESTDLNEDETLESTEVTE
jgi:hypothetical protein